MKSVEAVPTEGGQRHRFFKDLLEALWPSADGEKQVIHRTFAASEVLKYSEGFILKFFHVEGVGALELPLSVEDTGKLRSV